MNLIETIRIKSKYECINQKSCLITFLNPYSYLLARKNIDLFKKFDCIYIDGQLLVKMLSLFNISHTNRKSFDMTSLAPKVFEESIKKHQSIFFIGADAESIENTINLLREHYPLLKINGYRDGYFLNSMQREDVLNDIVLQSPDLVICGMGTPLQENFLYDLKESGWNGIGYTCGGFLHQTAKRIDYYPNWINKYNLRWAYRIYDEPKLFKRYFYQYPIAIGVFTFDYICFKFSRLI